MKSKIVAACLSALCVASCTAQTSNVTVAHSLYISCITGTLQANSIPVSPQDFRVFLIDLDSTCMDWTRAWYPAFVNRDQPEMTESEFERFNNLRQNTVGQIIDEYNMYLNPNTKKKK